MFSHKIIYGYALIVALVLGVSHNAWSLNNGLALTPPMGWNSYNKFGGNVTEAQVLAVAKAFVSDSLKAAGYRYIVIDYCWAGSSRDASGTLVPNATKFPHGMKYISDSIHALGLKFGMYECPTTTTCCSPEAGSYGHETKDAATFASWGVDYMKYDWCGVQSGEDKTSITAAQIIARYVTMRDAIKACGRPMVFALCEKGQKSKIPPPTWSDTVGNMWRVGKDINANWGRWFEEVELAAPYPQNAGPTKGWNDPDMLEVGNGSFTDTEYKTHFSMWCILAAPLMMGNDPATMPANIKSILTNTDVIGIDQDSLGAQGQRIRGNGNQEVWVKPLRNGDKAVVLLNKGTAAATVSVNWTDSLIKWPSSAKVKVRDLWTKTEQQNVTTSFSASVPSHGVVMVRLSNGTLVDYDAVMRSENLQNVQIKKTMQGINLYFPSREKGIAEIMDMQGKKIHSFEIQNGWNLIPSSRVLPGVFVVRVLSTRQSKASLIVNAVK